jgi:hypothetical protein
METREQATEFRASGLVHRPPDPHGPTSSRLARSEECQGNRKTLNQAPAGSRTEPMRADSAPIYNYFGLQFVWISNLLRSPPEWLCSVFETGKMSNLDKMVGTLRIWQPV